MLEIGGNRSAGDRYCVVCGPTWYVSFPSFHTASFFLADDFIIRHAVRRDGEEYAPTRRAPPGWATCLIWPQRHPHLRHRPTRVGRRTECPPAKPLLSRGARFLPDDRNLHWNPHLRRRRRSSASCPASSLTWPAGISTAAHWPAPAGGSAGAPRVVMDRGQGRPGRPRAGNRSSAPAWSSCNSGP